MTESLVRKINPFKPIGAAAKIEEAKNREPEVLADPLTVPNRIVLGFDDSGSMSGEPLQNAKKAVDGFLNQCNPKDTSIALYPFNMEHKPLTTKYIAVALMKETLAATGGTPLFYMLTKAIEEPLTRAVVFSDGQPTDGRSHEEAIITKYVEKKIPIDTVYIGTGDNDLLRLISERTGGIYLRFTDSKSLATSLKYLAPALRGMLMNPDVKARIERGEKI